MKLNKYIIVNYLFLITAQFLIPTSGIYLSYSNVFIRVVRNDLLEQNIFYRLLVIHILYKYLK